MGQRRNSNKFLENNLKRVKLLRVKLTSKQWDTEKNL